MREEDLKILYPLVAVCFIAVAYFLILHNRLFPKQSLHGFKHLYRNQRNGVWKEYPTGTVILWDWEYVEGVIGEIRTTVDFSSSGLPTLFEKYEVELIGEEWFISCHKYIKKEDFPELLKKIDYYFSNT